LLFFTGQRSKNRTSIANGAAGRKKGADSQRKCIDGLVFFAGLWPLTLAAGQGTATPADSAARAPALR